MAGLEGVRVLELGAGVAPAFAGKLLADLGADVWKLEEAGGDPARARGPFPGGRPDPEKSGLFLALHTNKRSARTTRARLERMLAWADIVVHDFPRAAMAERGLDWERLREQRPSLVLASITPFGLTGPRADWRATELVVANAGGWAFLSPGASRYPDAPPLEAAERQCDLQAGLAGAMTALAAYDRALATGAGEHVDLSAQAFVASALEQAFFAYTYQGLVATRHGHRGLQPWGIFECADGPIFLCTIEQDQWERLVALMGNPEWAQLEIFADFPSRLANWDVLHAQLGEWIAGWKVADLYRAGQARRICFAPIHDMRALAEHEQLRARDFFVPVEHPRAGKLVHAGAPYRLTRPWWQVRRPAPLYGEHDAESDRLEPAAAPLRTAAAPTRRLPLEGVRVADFSWVWAGPFCTLQLAHLGAEVIKLESAARPDLGRRLPIPPAGMEPGLNRSGYFNQWAQGKQSVLANLANPEGLALARRIAQSCDVVVENFATGVMDRIGLGYDTLRASRPDLIYASISGYGQTGPLREYMAYGPAIAPLSGLASLSGYAGGPPSEIGISYGDPNAGIHAAVAICAALVARRRTGEGQRIDVALWDAMAHLSPEAWMEHAMNGAQRPRDGNRDRQLSPHDCFRCAGEDAWVAIACATDAEFAALCGVLGLPARASDPRFATAAARKQNEDELSAWLTAWTRARDRFEIAHLLQAAGVPAYPSMSTKDLSEDPQLEARGFFARLPHPEVGVRTHAGIPWLLAASPNGVRAAAPLLGADTDAVLRGLLGLDAAEIERLRQSGALS